MADIEPRTHPRFVLVILCLASITILTLGYRGGRTIPIGPLKATARDLVAPVEGSISAAAAPVSNFVQGAASYSRLRAQNKRLISEVSRLKALSAGATATEQRLAQLTKLQHLTFAANLPHISAEVISTTSSNFEVSVEIDKGFSSGVRTGMPVVAGGGLVGRVIETSQTRSVVLLVTDPTSAIGVSLGGGTPVLGLASGQGAQAPLTVEYVAPGFGVRPGEEAVTTQVKGGTVPPGIPLGVVSSVHSVPGALQQNIEVNPFVRLEDLAFVDVLRWQPNG